MASAPLAKKKIARHESAGPNRSEVNGVGLRLSPGSTPRAHYIVGDLVAFVEAGEASALDRRDVNEHILAAVARLDEAEALGSIEEFYSTRSHQSIL